MAGCNSADDIFRAVATMATLSPAFNSTGVRFMNADIKIIQTKNYKLKTLLYLCNSNSTILYYENKWYSPFRFSYDPVVSLPSLWLHVYLRHD